MSDQNIEFPKENERDIALKYAAIELNSSVIDLFAGFDLTASEMFMLLSREMTSLAKTCMYEERKENEKTDR